MRVDFKDKIFETRVKPTSEETYAYLRGYRPPSGAFVLFEKQEIKLTGDGGSITFGTGLFTLNLEHRPEQIGKMHQYMGKGFKVLHWDNFPGVHKTDSRAMARTRLYSQGDNHKNPWEEVDDFLKSAIQNSPHLRKELENAQDKLAVTEAKLKEMEALLAKSDRAAAAKTKGGTDGGLHP